jgi:hypothetical protein
LVENRARAAADHFLFLATRHAAGTISFAVDPPSAYRSNAGVESLRALVLDLDHGEPN